MKISIITPSFNQGKFIEQTIKSVLNQKYPDLEYIIIDGSSTDETISILKKYSGKIKWVSEKDKGQSDAINKGMERATGDVLAFLNSDDIYLPGTLKKISSFFKKNPQAKWVSGDYLIIDENGKKIRQFVVWYKWLLRRFSSRFLMKISNYVIQPSTFWRREIKEEIGNFNQSLHYVMDYDYWLRVNIKYPLYILYEPLSAFRIHSLSKSGAQYKKQFQEENEIVKKYTENNLIRLIHGIHSWLTILFYDLIY